MTAEADVATFDLDAVRRFADLAVEGLAAAREEIDALNVYPVPDGDTGTNMFLTVESARDAMVAALDEAPGRPPGGDAGLRQGCPARRARQLRGHPQPAGRRAAAPDRPGRARRTARRAVFAEGMALATDAAYAAVGKPVEGTILSVARAASEAAAEAARIPEDRLGDVVRAAAGAAREALARTPEQLPLLAQAGVVDAGGRGLCVVLDAAESAITGKRRHHGDPPRRHPGDPGRADPHRRPDRGRPGVRGDVPPRGRRRRHPGAARAARPARRLPRRRRRRGAVERPRPRRRRRRRGRGRHPRRCAAPDPGHPLRRADRAGPREAGRAAWAQAGHRRSRPGPRRAVRRGGGRGHRGRPRSSPQHRPSSSRRSRRPGPRRSSCCPTTPTRSASRRRPPTRRSTRASTSSCIPTRAQVQGIAALAVHEPGRPLDSDVVHMTAAARGARHGAVTVAARSAMTTAGPCSAGDALGRGAR